MWTCQKYRPPWRCKGFFFHIDEHLERSKWVPNSAFHNFEASKSVDGRFWATKKFVKERILSPIIYECSVGNHPLRSPLQTKFQGNQTFWAKRSMYIKKRKRRKIFPPFLPLLARVKENEREFIYVYLPGRRVSRSDTSIYPWDRENSSFLGIRTFVWLAIVTSSSALVRAWFNLVCVSIRGLTKLTIRGCCVPIRKLDVGLFSSRLPWLIHPVSQCDLQPCSSHVLTRLFSIRSRPQLAHCCISLNSDDSNSIMQACS